MATKGGHIDFMFLAPPYLAARPATAEALVGIEPKNDHWFTSLVLIQLY